ncbi:bacteriophage lysis protein [Escherichia coli]|uniref:Bacteriophage lysis protein n=1 Tax=Escherichia coli TaxID=562 RepID=A0A376ZHX2_ECOLX|nr:bacteriophage lysis protein [Escherichia coli]
MALKLVGIRHCCCQMWRLVLTVLKMPRWSFYEAEAKKQAKQFFMDVAAGLCEGDGPLPEKAPRNFRGAGCVDNLQRKTTGNNYWFSEDSTAGLKT